MSQQLLDTILEHSTNKDSRIHGRTHWAAATAAGHTLCELTPEADADVVLAFSLLHDSMRESDGPDPEHGARAAELAERLQESGELELNADKLAKLTEALEFHDKGQTSADPTIGACWDADRINLYRVGITPEASFMSTEGGRSLVGTERAKYFPMFVFSWSAIFLNFEALLGLGEPGEHLFLRFGDLPEGGISHYASYTRPEEGVSVYPGYRAGDVYRIDARRMMLGTETRLVRHLLHQGRPLYVVEGRYIGMGGSGEPLLADARIVREITPDARIEVLPQRPEIEGCISWWRGEREGEFPYPPEVSLTCDRGGVGKPEEALADYGLRQLKDSPGGRAYLSIKAKLEVVQRKQREMFADPSNMDLRRQAAAAGFDLQKEMHKIRERSKTPQQREAERILRENWRRYEAQDRRTRQQRIDEGERSRRQLGQKRSWES